MSGKVPPAKKAYDESKPRGVPSVDTDPSTEDVTAREVEKSIIEGVIGGMINAEGSHLRFNILY